VRAGRAEFSGRKAPQKRAFAGDLRDAHRNMKLYHGGHREAGVFS
jgi:hypothetical protein